MSNFILNDGYNLSKNFLKNGNRDKVKLGNKKFIDLSNCSGALLLGHNHRITRNAIKNYLKKNLTSSAYPNTSALEFSKIIKKLFPNFKKMGLLIG